MSDGVLYIGQSRHSSWSMQGWLAVQPAGLEVGIRVIRFRQSRTAGVVPGSLP